MARKRMMIPELSGKDLGLFEFERPLKLTILAASQEEANRIGAQIFAMICQAAYEQGVIGRAMTAYSKPDPRYIPLLRPEFDPEVADAFHREDADGNESTG